MPAREFVDSNIWLYASVLAGDAGAEQKHYRASDLLSRVDRPVINSQVVREVCSNLLQKAKLGEADVQRVIQDWYPTCERPQGRRLATSAPPRGRRNTWGGPAFVSHEQLRKTDGSCRRG